MGEISFGEEEAMQKESNARIEELKVSPMEQKLIRQGFANSQQQARIVLTIIFILTLVGSAFLLLQSKEFQPKAKPTPRDPYTRPIPG